MPGKATAIIASLFLALLIAAPATAADPELAFGQVPFGKPVDQVLKAYKSSDVTQEQTPYIESIGSETLEKYFKGGLKRDDSGVCFLPNIVRKYTVKNPAWKNFSSVTLYFGAFEKGAKDYTLFMAKGTRSRPPAEADFKEVFNALARAVGEATRVSGAVDQGRIQSFGEQSHTYYLPALVGTWDAGETLVFVMAANSPEGPLPPEEVFVSKPALKRYLEVCKTY